MMVGAPRKTVLTDLPDGFASRVAINLVRLRKQAGLSVRAAAEAAGIPKTNWYRMESGLAAESCGANLDRAAAALGVDLVELVRGPRQVSKNRRR